ncbi:MAG: dTDP-4-dehydrorhamnose 3,5-epimerase [Candidatus Eisenbacteria bacterium]|nr:dTDP-4-dehydrorhamnose 3,5-epimerase [Candidatus Eisenbacteria bacterium]
MIDGVVTKELRVIPDARGFLMEIMRRDDPFFRQFGQAYMTVAYPGVVKGWHYHRKQTDHFCVVKGMGKVVLYDRRDGSPTQGEVNEFFVGERKPLLIRIPPGVAHGIKGVGTEPVYLLNVPDEVYDYDEPDEYRIAPHGGEIPYDWSDHDG